MNKEIQPRIADRLQNWPYWRPLLGVAMFTLALWALHQALHQYPPHELFRSVQRVPALSLLFAALFSAGSYWTLTGYDLLALHYLGKPLPYSRVALASFAGYAFANNTGSLSILTGGSVRYRLYTGWGLSAGEVAHLIGFSTLTFWLGLLVCSGTVFLIEPIPIPGKLPLPGGSLRIVGIVFLCLVAGYLFWSARRRHPIRLGTWQVVVPSLRFSAAQIGLAAADLGLASAALYTLLPPGGRPSFPLYFGFFLLSQVVGLISTVPGGLGVFEGAMVLMLAPSLSADRTLGPLLAFRAVYYLFPLIAATFALSAHELLVRRKALRSAAESLRISFSHLVPQLLGMGVFAAGAILLFSGATPAVANRMTWLRRLVPLPLIEISHLTGSLCGAALLVLARALQRRVDAAYVLACVLLTVGIGASLLKGLDFEEATILAVFLLALLPCRREFHRKAALVAEFWSPGWAGTIAVVLIGSLWIGLLAYRHQEYRSELWWRFALDGDAPRFLRASFCAVLLLVGLAFMKLLQPGRHRPVPITSADLDTAAEVAARSIYTESYLALLVSCLVSCSFLYRFLLCFAHGTHTRELPNQRL